MPGKLYSKAAVGILACLLPLLSITEVHAADGPAQIVELELNAPAVPASEARFEADSRALAPGISPWTYVEYRTPGEKYRCYVQNFCAVVWDPTRAKWAIFFLYNCARYDVFYWGGPGRFDDNQTAGTRTYFYDEAEEIASFAAPWHGISYNWDPVYSIENC